MIQSYLDPISIPLLNTKDVLLECRWPMDGRRSYEPNCCGLPVLIGKPYCFEHYRISMKAVPNG